MTQQPLWLACPELWVRCHKFQRNAFFTKRHKPTVRRRSLPTEAPKLRSSWPTATCSRSAGRAAWPSMVAVPAASSWHGGERAGLASSAVAGSSSGRSAASSAGRSGGPVSLPAAG
jgi:hypothetical protein